ncbi:hypothetical protein [Nafulsella turpanensis]|uniref:hypothetical protein n=1 Tax=Nafulsella turpanensis TaxID=1265690 RepID=UPI0003466D3E|nr:hypothetical protein [Nafulsella turpanensis]
MEVILILIIIPLQGYLAWQTYQKIKALEFVFESTEDAEIITGDVPVSLVRSGKVEPVKDYIISEEKVFHGESTIEMALLSVSPRNEVEKDIITNINGYLLKNKGAVADYHLLKDIVDRNIDSLDEEINNSMPAPLYLGLAATMFGIIIGLYNMPDFSAGTFSPDILMPLLDGVKVAMMASVLGLLLTTGLSIVFYKPSKSQAEKNKNGFLSFLQINLLPELVRTETSGISALNDRLKRFGNILSPTIKDLSQVVERSLQAVSIQENIISKVEGLNTTQLAKANAKVFQELSQMMDSFKQFAVYYQELNRSMSQTVDLTSNLKELVGRTIEVEKIAKGIDSTFTQNKEINDYFSKHFEEFESREAAMKSVVDSSERALVDIIEQMKGVVKRKADEVKEVTVEMEPKLRHAFDSSIRAVENITKDQVHQIEKVFESSKPKFEKLEKLDKIEEGINILATQGVRDSEKQDLLLLAVKELTTVMKETDSKKSESRDNDALLLELRNISKGLENFSRGQRKEDESEEKDNDLDDNNEEDGNYKEIDLSQVLMSGIDAVKSKPKLLIGIKVTGAISLIAGVGYVIVALLDKTFIM